MRRLYKSLFLVLPFCLVLTIGAAAWSNLDGQLWDEVGMGGDPERVRDLLAQGANANIKGLSGAPLLMFADTFEVVQALIEQGADVNVRTPDGETILHQNVFGGKVEIVELLLAAGADFNAKNLDGETPLFIAAYKGWKEIAGLLLAKGADVNARDNANKTPLHTAASQGKKEVVELLIAKGADVNAVKADGISILSATCIQDAEVVTMLKAAGATGKPVHCKSKVFLSR